MSMLRSSTRMGVSSLPRGTCCAVLVLVALGCSGNQRDSVAEQDRRGEEGGSGGVAGDAAQQETGGAAAGATTEPIVLYAFNDGTEGFNFGDEEQTPPYINPYAPPDGGARVGTFSIEHSDRDFDANSKTPGCLKVTATFAEWNDVLQVETDGPRDTEGQPIDLSHRIVRANLYLEQGLSPAADAPGGYNLNLKTGSNWAWGLEQVWNNFVPYDTWIEAQFDTTVPNPTDTPADFDPKHPVQLGFEFMSGTGGTQTEFGEPLETTIYIDNIVAIPKP